MYVPFGQERAARLRPAPSIKYNDMICQGSSEYAGVGLVHVLCVCSYPVKNRPKNRPNLDLFLTEYRKRMVERRQPWQECEGQQRFVRIVA